MSPPGTTGEEDQRAMAAAAAGGGKTNGGGGGGGGQHGDQQHGAAAAAAAAARGGTAAPAWSLSIKPVGGGGGGGGGGDFGFQQEPGSLPESDFKVEVCPDDGVDALYEQIEGVTGLKACQQRLIYRGRLIGNGGSGNGTSSGGSSAASAAAAGDEDSRRSDDGKSDDAQQQHEEGKGDPSSSSSDGGRRNRAAAAPKIKDITGLCDGQTIHLLRRREQQQQQQQRGGPGGERGQQQRRQQGGSAVSRAGGSYAPSTAADGDEGEAILGSSSVAPLLASILGLGDDPAAYRNPADANSGAGGGVAFAAAGTGSGNRRSWRSSSSASTSSRYGGGGGGSSSRRRPHHRLTADDLDVADPGSMESVRQGMMTLHSSMIPHARATVAAAAAATVAASEEGRPILRSPSDTDRRWYVGQWIDCLDTVNQWLEATVVEIVYAEDVLPPPSSAAAASSPSTTTASSITAGGTDRAVPGGEEELEAATGVGGGGVAPVPALPRAASPPDSYPSATTRRARAAPASSHFSDPVVPASDLEGRRRLLLEPCAEGDDGDLSGDLAGFRRREADAGKGGTGGGGGVQLLLVHYNGWPHRWDEWIRGDSDRIRPFRVRTRHPSSSSRAAPTPQSAYAESPPTFIVPRNESDSADRAALLPELGRVLSAVNDLVAGAAASAPADGVAAAATANAAASAAVSGTPQSGRPGGSLPWVSCDGGVDGLGAGGSSSVREEPAIAASPPAGGSRRQTIQRRRELEALAPLLDRLGRTLIDAAPHVSALARSLTENALQSADETPELETIEEHPTSLGGLLSLLSRDRRRQSNASSNVGVPGDSVSASHGSVQTGTSTEDDVSIDPDLTDFASGIVNTTRGDVRRGPRSSTSSSDDAASLLGAYLAAASLGSLQSAGGGGGGSDDNDQNGGGSLSRLLRDRGGGGGGIDIHIHAVVTAPGLPTGGLGLATLGGGTPIATPVTPTNETAAAASTTPTLFSSGRGFGGRGSRQNNSSPRTPSIPLDDDDLGIFSQLYSETPEPIDPNSDGTPTSERSSTAAAGRSNPSNRRESPRNETTSHNNPTTPSPPSRATSLSASSGHSRSSRGSRRTGSSRGDPDRSRRSGSMLGRFFRRESPDRG